MHIFLLLLTLVCSAPAAAGGLTAAIFAIPPWGYRDAQGRITGIEYEIVQAIAEHLDEPVAIELLPYKRMIRHLETGEADFAIFYRSERSEEVAEPLVKWGELDIIVIGRAGREITTYEDLRSLDIAVRLGGYFGERFDNDTALNKRPVENYARGVKMLMAGRVDAVVGTAATLYYELRKQQVDMDEVGRPFFLVRKEDWLHFSRKSPRQDKKDDIVAIVEKLVRQGRFAEIFARYLPAQWQHR